MTFSTKSCSACPATACPACEQCASNGTPSCHLQASYSDMTADSVMGKIMCLCLWSQVVRPWCTTRSPANGTCCLWWTLLSVLFTTWWSVLWLQQQEDWFAFLVNMLHKTAIVHCASFWYATSWQNHGVVCLRCLQNVLKLDSPSWVCCMTDRIFATKSSQYGRIEDRLWSMIPEIQPGLWLVAALWAF